MTPLPTVGVLRAMMARRLSAAFAARSYEGTPALDARLLLGHVLGIDAAEVPLRDEQAVTEDAARRATALAERRGAGEPVSRIVGWREFHGHRLLLSPDTLDPRPDTETLVDAVLAELARRAAAAPTILDLGTGSGAILLALLAALPKATGVGVDIAPGAVAAATGNALRLGLAGRATFVAGDWSADIDRRFDVVVSNPPYIETGTIESLPLEVRGFDPHLALDGGADGLDAIRAISADLDRVLAEGGAAFIEIGAGQAARAAGIARSKGFSCRMVSDLAGIERVAVLRRNGESSGA